MTPEENSGDKIEQEENPEEITEVNYEVDSEPVGVEFREDNKLHNEFQGVMNVKSSVHCNEKENHNIEKKCAVQCHDAIRSLSILCDTIHSNVGGSDASLLGHVMIKLLKASGSVGNITISIVILINPILLLQPVLASRNVSPILSVL